MLRTAIGTQSVTTLPKRLPLGRLRHRHLVMNWGRGQSTLQCEKATTTHLVRPGLEPGTFRV